MPRKREHIVLDLTDADDRPPPMRPRKKIFLPGLQPDHILIEDQIPLPTRFRDLASKYPFAQMKPGQSFFVAGEPLATCRKLCQAVANYKRKENNGREFMVRSRNKEQPENVNAMREVGARCWRIK